jgi:hypothetical protein
MADLPLQETHSLDYVPENWSIAQISGVHKHVVYDTATLVSYNEYLNQKGLFLRIKQITIGFDNYPGMLRNHRILNEEKWRVFLQKKANKSVFAKTPMSFFCRLSRLENRFSNFLTSTVLRKAHKENWKKMQSELKNKSFSYRKYKNFYTKETLALFKRKKKLIKKIKSKINVYY